MFQSILSFFTPPQTVPGSNTPSSSSASAASSPGTTTSSSSSDSPDIMSQEWNPVSSPPPQQQQQQQQQQQHDRERTSSQRRNTAAATAAPRQPSPTTTVSRRASYVVMTSTKLVTSPQPNPYETQLRRLEADIRERTAELRQKSDLIVSLRTQITRMRPSATAPWTPPPEVNEPLEPIAVEIFRQQADVGAFVRVIADAYLARIKRLDDILARLDKELGQLRSDLHGLQLRRRTYEKMIAFGAPIAEYTQHLDVCKQQTINTTS